MDGVQTRDNNSKQQKDRGDWLAESRVWFWTASLKCLLDMKENMPHTELEIYV